MKPIRWAATLFAAVALPALAQVGVADPWVRGTVPGQLATGAFMTLTSRSGARLVGVASPLAGVVEIHETTLDGTVMRMRAVAALELPAGRAVELTPGGYHVMLMDLKRPLKEGETVPLTLTVETGGRRETVAVKAVVRAPTARSDATKRAAP